jgi:hypothetical protein
MSFGHPNSSWMAHVARIGLAGGFIACQRMAINTDDFRMHNALMLLDYSNLVSCAAC